MGTPMQNSDIQKALVSLPGWTQIGPAIEKLYEFPNFVDAMVFVNKVAELAEEVNHHPDIKIVYNKVTLQLVSHDSGGVTQRDLRMAGRINELGR